MFTIDTFNLGSPLGEKSGLTLQRFTLTRPIPRRRCACPAVSRTKTASENVPNGNKSWKGRAMRLTWRTANTMRWTLPIAWWRRNWSWEQALGALAALKTELEGKLSALQKPLSAQE